MKGSPAASAPIRCAVHYVQQRGNAGFWYCVRPAGEALDVSGMQEGQSLSDYAAGRWAAGRSWGLAVVGVAQGALWLLDASNRRRKREADPLYGWLPSGSTWGAQGSAEAEAKRRAAFRLLKRGQDTAASPLAPELFEDETRGFVEHAYTFPTDARTRGRIDEFGMPGGEVLTRRRRTTVSAPGTNPPALYDLHGAPGSVTLRIAPEYVPAMGTLMVDANVSTAEDVGLAEAEIRCVVHFVQVGEGRFRYCVRPEEGQALDLSGLGPEQSLKDLAEDEGWPVSEAATMRLPKDASEEDGARVEEELQVLSLAVVPQGQGLPAAAQLQDRAQTWQERLEQEGVLGPGDSAPYPLPEGPASALDTAQIRRAHATVEAPGLAAILSAETQMEMNFTSELYRYEGPRFTVRGAVYFDLSALFNPQASIPRTDESGNVVGSAEDDAQPPLLSRAQIGTRPPGSGMGAQPQWRFPEDMPFE